MSKLSILGAFAVLLAATGMTVAAPNDSSTSNGNELQTQQPPAQTGQHQQYQSNYRGQISASSDTNRASSIIGTNVKSPNDDTIGEIDDLVLDTNTGKIRYAAVSVGGFLGIGDKLVAVPWQAFKCQKDSDGETQLSLNTTKEKLKSAPTFDEDHYPNFADPNWTRENDSHYDTQANVNR